MKMADTDEANVEVMQDVDIVQERDNSNPVLHVQEKAGNGENLREEARCHVVEGTENSRDASNKNNANKKDKDKENDCQQGVAFLCVWSVLCR
jgi:hypothetical protein